VVAIVSFASLAAPAALASTVLGILMIAGADVDARTFLLPDTVTGGTLVSGLLAAAALDPFDPARSAGEAAVRAVGTAAALLLVRLGLCPAPATRGRGLGRRQARGRDRGLASGSMPFRSARLCGERGAGRGVPGASSGPASAHRHQAALWCLSVSGALDGLLCERLGRLI